jgi:hypothetical protein
VSWKRAFSQIYNTISWLHGFSTINIIACQKILKKFKKHFGKINNEKTTIIFDELHELLSKQLFFENNNEVDTITLRKEIKNFYADYFTDGNKISAKHSLQSRMRPYRKRDVFYLAFNLGMLCIQVLFFIIANFNGNNN